MVESWDGSLSCTEFYVAACAFAQQWSKFNSSLLLPQWAWLPSPNRPCWISHHNQLGYLCMENVILPPRSLSEDARKRCDDIEKDECHSEYEDDEVVDNAVVVHNGGPGVHRYDFHVVYSSSYRVPVLYFRAYCHGSVRETESTDMNEPLYGQPLSLDEIEKDITVNSAQLLTKSKWTFMTQEEHPELNRPWYTLHPCGTSEWMKLLLSTGASIAQVGIPVEKYMLSWFSVVGQVFGLKLPFDMLNLAGAL